MQGLADGQVHKIIRLVATSSTSWEDAARAGVDEAVKTINDLRSATVIETDTVIQDGHIVRYRVKLELGFQLDRSRLKDDGTVGLPVRRYLVVANQTLPTPGLEALINDKVATGNVEFHVLVPEAPPTVIYNDPSSTFDHHLAEVGAHDRLISLEEAEERLDSFRETFAHLGSALTGEVGVGDPITAVRRVMDRASFDEIVVSTLPPGLSRWLRLDLPARLERNFHLPVTPLIQEE